MDSRTLISLCWSVPSQEAQVIFENHFLGMERADLLKDNGKIFVETGKALNDHAKRSVKVVVVGNPCNTNCLIASHYAKDIPKENFTAMTKLDHNRGLT